MTKKSIWVEPAWKPLLSSSFSLQSSLCKIGIFELNENDTEGSGQHLFDKKPKEKFTRIWLKSTDETERRRWAWNNPGIGQWEIRLEISNDRMKKTATTRFIVK